MAIRSRSIFVVLAGGLAVALGASTAAAQADLSSYTRTEVGRLRNQSLGSDLKATQISNRTLRQGVQVGIPGVRTLANPGSFSSSFGTRRAASFDSFGSRSGGAKPFSSVSRGPTVSPYLNLFVGTDGLAGDDEVALNYQTLVKPQIRQQEINQSFQLQQQALNRRVQQLSARPAFDPRGSQTQSPTGHPTAFFNHSHFYPSAGGQR